MGMSLCVLGLAEELKGRGIGVNALWPLARPVLHALDPERAHDVTLRALAAMPLPKPAPDDPRLAVSVFGLRFANPLGLAAGFDKNGVLADKAGRLGFGFTEVGTVTPQPHDGRTTAMSS